uniref:glutathione transferase n=1 Tax=Chelydra serpentina TaxID=8475 RepID=A0A8C3RNX5_CHESE
MAGKPKLYYLNGRGRMESIRWLLAAAGVEVCFGILNHLCIHLPQNGYLLFQQLPLVEIDGMKMVQTRAILSYIAAKYNLCGKDLKERIMYCNSTIRTQSPVVINQDWLWLFCRPKQKKTKTNKRPECCRSKKKKRGGGGGLNSNQTLPSSVRSSAFTQIDVVFFSHFLTFKNSRISKIPTVKKFLEPGSQRKPVPDDKYAETVKRVLQMSF